MGFLLESITSRKSGNGKGMRENLKPRPANENSEKLVCILRETLGKYVSKYDLMRDMEISEPIQFERALLAARRRGFDITSKCISQYNWGYKLTYGEE